MARDKTFTKLLPLLFLKMLLLWLNDIKVLSNDTKNCLRYQLLCLSLSYMIQCHLQYQLLCLFLSYIWQFHQDQKVTVLSVRQLNSSVLFSWTDHEKITFSPVFKTLCNYGYLSMQIVNIEFHSPPSEFLVYDWIRVRNCSHAFQHTSYENLFVQSRYYWNLMKTK